jgi:hypothetical protein
MAEDTTNPGADVSAADSAVEDAFIAQMMGKEAPKAEPVKVEEKPAPVEPTADAEPATEDEQDAGDETPEEAEEPANDAAPTITPRMARLAERFLTGGFRYSTARVDKFDDAGLVQEAEARATETLKLAKYPERVIKAMTPDERFQAALEWRPRLVAAQQEYSRSKANGLPAKQTIGEGRTSARTQPLPGAVKDSDPTGLDDELDLADPAVKTAYQKLRAEKEALEQRTAALTRRVTVENLASAIGTVDDDRPGVADDHEAVLAAAKDIAHSSNLDFDEIAATGGDELVRLVERAADELRFTRKPRERAASTLQVNRTPKTPPRPSGRGGSVRAMTDDAKDQAAVEAIMSAKGDLNRASAIYGQRVSQ